jgi:hypothetical protein
VAISLLTILLHQSFQHTFNMSASFIAVATKRIPNLASLFNSHAAANSCAVLLTDNQGAGETNSWVSSVGWRSNCGSSFQGSLSNFASGACNQCVREIRLLHSQIREGELSGRPREQTNCTTSIITFARDSSDCSP